MGERTKAAVRVLTVLAGTLVAFVAAGFAGDTLLGQILGRDTQGRYTIVFSRGEGYWMVIASVASLITFLLLTALVVKIVYRRRPVDPPLVVLGGYAAACLAAGFALVLIYALGYGSGASSPLGAPPGSVLEVLGSLYMGTLAAGMYVGVFAFLPTLAVVIYTERNGVRSPLFYAIAGAASALVAFGIYLAVFLLAGAPIDLFSASRVRDALLLFVAPGLFGGLTYWLIAGRMTREKTAAEIRCN